MCQTFCCDLIFFLSFRQILRYLVPDPKKQGEIEILTFYSFENLISYALYIDKSVVVQPFTDLTHTPHPEELCFYTCGKSIYLG